MYSLLSFTWKAPSVDPVTTCKDPPASSSLVLLLSSNVTWMSDCASAGTSLDVGKQHLIQPQTGWELSLASPSWIMWALPVIAGPPLVLYCHLSATHRLEADWPGGAGRASRAHSASNAGAGSLVGPARLPCAAWNEVILRTGICVAAFQSPTENLHVYQKKSRLNLYILCLSPT